MTRTTKQQATQHAYVYYFLDIIRMKPSRDFQSFVAILKSGPVAMCFHKKKGLLPNNALYYYVLPSYSFQTRVLLSLCYLFVL